MAQEYHERWKWSEVAEKDWHASHPQGEIKFGSESSKESKWLLAISSIYSTMQVDEIKTSIFVTVICSKLAASTDALIPKDENSGVWSDCPAWCCCWHLAFNQCNGPQRPPLAGQNCHPFLLLTIWGHGWNREPGFGPPTVKSSPLDTFGVTVCIKVPFIVYKELIGVLLKV